MKYDRRRNYYLILDCETATLPYASQLDGSAKQKIAIAKPLIYDLGWQVIDRQGRVYAKKQYLISEIFSVPSVFNTAYYASKRPLYIDKLNKGEITLTDWGTAIGDLLDDLDHCVAVGAYNSMFDFKKAIPFTEDYISHLYSNDYYRWEEWQNHICDDIASGKVHESNKVFDPYNFSFRNRNYPLFDVWGMACEFLLNNDDYKQMCIDNEWLTASGTYFKTSAETAFRFYSNEMDFDESHTALDDAIIESEIFSAIIKKDLSHLTIGITYFPFRILGKVADF